MSSIGSITGSAYSQYSGSTQAMRRPDPAAMAEKLFSKLDSSGQGYIEETDLQSALSSLTTSGSGSDTSASTLFKQLDSDSDGKVTKDEFTDSIKKLADELDQQFMNMRLQAGMSGMGQMQGGSMPPPPPPPGGAGGDAGFTKSEMQDQLKEIGSSNTEASNLLSSVVNNFDAADTDGDGKVSFKEALSYQQGLSSSDGSSAASSASDSQSSGNASRTRGSDQASTEVKLMQQIMRLAQAYNVGGSADSSGIGALLSITT